MNCKFCGNEMDENQSSCTACGKDQETPVEAAVEAPTEKKPSNTKWLLIAGAAAVVLLATIGTLVATGLIAFNTTAEPTETVTELTVAQETVVSATSGEFTSDITLAMVDEDGVFIPHDFVIDDELLTEEIANTVVATVGDQEMNNTLFNYYYYQQYMNFFSEYGSYITMIMDPSQSLATQMLSETQSIQDMLVQGAVYSYQQEAALYCAAQAEGFVLSEMYAVYAEDIEAQLTTDVVAQGFVDAEDYLISFYGPHATMDSFMQHVMLSLTAMDFIQQKTADVSNTEEEILAYYDENVDNYTYYGVTKDSVLVDARHVLITPKDDGNSTTDEYGSVVYSEESWAAALAEAEALLADWEAGEATEDSFAAMATEFTEDPGSASTGGLYTDIYTGQMVETFDAWCFDASRQYGDTDIVETSYGYHIMYFVGSKADDTWYTTADDDLLYDKQVAIQEGYVNQYDFAVNYNNVAIPHSQLEDELAAMYGY